MIEEIIKEPNIVKNIIHPIIEGPPTPPGAQNLIGGDGNNLIGGDGNNLVGGGNT